MESTITGAIESVKGKPTSKGTVFEIVIGGTTYSTWKNEIAEEANALQGSTVEANVKVEQKGEYTNRYLNAIKLVDAGGNGATASAVSGTSTIPVAPPTEKKGWQPEDTARVTRLSCLSTAFQYAGDASLDVDEALALAQRLYGVAMGTPEPQTVVAAVSASEQTDDVPW